MRESKRMGTNFEEAVCTLAAVDVLDAERQDHGGLFLPREPDSLAIQLFLPYLIPDRPIPKRRPVNIRALTRDVVHLLVSPLGPTVLMNILNLFHSRDTPS
jgi:hypothetical protein